MVRKAKVMYNTPLWGPRTKRLQRSRLAEMKGELMWQRTQSERAADGLPDDFHLSEALPAFSALRFCNIP